MLSYSWDVWSKECSSMRLVSLATMKAEKLFRSRSDQVPRSWATILHSNTTIMPHRLEPVIKRRLTMLVVAGSQTRSWANCGVQVARYSSRVETWSVPWVQPCNRRLTKRAMQVSLSRSRASWAVPQTKLSKWAPSYTTQAPRNCLSCSRTPRWVRSLRNPSKPC